MTDLSRMRRVLPGILLALGATNGVSAQSDAMRGPPPDGPVHVAIGFYVVDIVDLNMDEKTFEFEGILSARWTDPRLAFDPAEVGVDERIYQGDYQFAEIFTGWWPPLVLRNESGRYERQGVLLRVAATGEVTLVEEIQAIAELAMDLRRVPFDRQRFAAEFEVLGYGTDEVVLHIDEERTGIGATTLTQWTLSPVESSTEARDPGYLREGSPSVSAAIFAVPAQRRPQYLLRLVFLPIMIFVALSWSVFWMDRESLGSRMDITFIAILTVVAFQIVVSDQFPRISYFTIMSSFMFTTYMTLGASVVVNLRVNAHDRSGRVEAGNRLDYRCRWMFPLCYVLLLAGIIAYYFIRY